MINKIKAGAQEAATNAGIEAEYLKGKKSGFNHPPEVETQIAVMREIRDEIPVLREDVSTMLNHTKELATAETKTGTDFLTMSEHPSQHPQLKTIMQLYSAILTATASNRFNLHATVEQIKEEWKLMETVDLKEIRVKQDQTNRSWSTKRYWDKEKKPAKSAEFDSRYKCYVSELVHLIHALREKKEDLVPGYILGIIQAEMEFHRKSLEELVKCENTIRSMGRVTPIRFTDYDQFAPLPNSDDPTMAQIAPAPSSAPVPSPVPIPRSTTHTSGIRAKGVYPFQGQSPDELSFNPGDILNIISQSGDWWTAELNGRQGVIPSNYVQLL